MQRKLPHMLDGQSKNSGTVSKIKQLNKKNVQKEQLQTKPSIIPDYQEVLLKKKELKWETRQFAAGSPLTKNVQTTGLDRGYNFLRLNVQTENRCINK